MSTGGHQKYSITQGSSRFLFFFCRGPNNRYFRLWDYTLCCDCSALPGCTKAATDKWAGCALIKFNLHKPVACGFPAVSALFLAYSFLMEESLHPRQKSTSHRCLGLFWTLNSIPLVFISVFVPAPLFWLQQLWNQKVWVFHLFLFQYYLGYSESLQFSMNLRISFSISVKKNTIGILIGIALNLSTTLGSIAFLTM